MHTRRLFSFLSVLPVLQAAPVINEIHYNNEDNTILNEFVEIHNPDPVEANLGGWQLDGAVSYTFPAGTTIPSGGYLVIAEDPASLTSEFSVPAIGPYDGGLNSDGELLQLLDSSGAEMDRVDYGVGFPWPSRAMGEGSSMELINPNIDNDLGSSWRSSGIGFNGAKEVYIDQGSSWRFRKGLSEASSPIHAWTAHEFAEDDTWESGVAPIGRNEPAFVETNLADAQNGYASVFLRKTFNVTGSPPSSALLKLLYDDGVIVWLNGVEIFRSPSVDPGIIDYQGNDPANAGGNGASVGNHEKNGYEEFTIGGTAGLLQTGENTMAIQLFNSTIGSSDILIDATLETPEPFSEPSPPTPGKPNNSATNSPPPNIRQVNHSPVQPSSSNPVTISAKITDPDGVESVSLDYQIVHPGSYIRLSDAAYESGWTTLEMTDPDGDSIYSAEIPAQEHRRLVRYRIHTNDTVGAGLTAPFDDDEQPNFAYFVYDGVPAWTGASNPGSSPLATFTPDVLEDIPTYHLISNATDVTNSQYSGGSDGVHMQGTLVYDGKVYDHIEFENRGEASTYQSGKNKWRFHFNPAHDFEARDNWGNKYTSTWDTLNFDACASPWAPVHRGMAGVEEAASYRLFELAGIPSPRTHYVHFRVIDATAESNSNQYESDLWGLYLAVEHPDGAFLDNRNLPDGNVYKIQGSAGKQKHQAKDQPVNGSDWNSFRTSSGSTQNEAYWRSNMNLFSYYTFRAGNRITGNVDVREGFNHYFYHNPVAGWTVMPWDLDMMFIAETHWSGTIQQKACLNVQALAVEYRNRAREMFDLLCTDASIDGGQMAQLIDEYAQIVNPNGRPLTWSDVDEYMWNYHPRTRGNPNSHSGQGNHKGNWFYSPFVDSRRGGSYTRTLSSSDHEGSMEYLINYATDTFTGGTWAPGNGQQDGYGYEYVKRDANDPAIPNTPTITYTGDAGFPTSGLSFECSNFSDPQGNGSFAAMQWRIGEISTSPDQPNIYEIEENWTSGEIVTFAASIDPPAYAVKPNRTYRARVRHQDNTGRWSHWSAPVQFQSMAPDIDLLQQNLVISELMYNPTGDDAVEFIELFNTGDTDLDLTNVRFTKGIDYDFVEGTTIAAGNYLLVVKNRAAFEAKYGAGLPIADGEYGDDSLSNGGENLKLALGTLAIHEFSFDDDSPWNTSADGGGYSLILSHTTDNAAADPLDPLGHGIATNWRAGSAMGGSPGQAEPTDTLSGAPDADLDSDGLDALIEHAFGTSDSASNQLPLTISVINGYPSLTFPVNPLADDVSYHVETSPDLEAWTTINAPSSQTSHSRTYTPPLADPTSKLFFRVRVRQEVAIPR